MSRCNPELLAVRISGTIVCNKNDKSKKKNVAGCDSDDDDDDDEVLFVTPVQVFLSHRSIYLLLFDLRHDLSTTTTTTQQHRPMTSTGDTDVSLRDGRR